jgi:hypothetical protein
MVSGFNSPSSEKMDPFFDAYRERIDELPIWVRLPGLSPECWSWKCFEKIGNTLGTFMKEDMSFSTSGKMFVARILVSLNFRKGLSATLELSQEGKTFSQSLDYEGIPFKCHRCHKHSHRAVDCLLPMKRRPPKGLNHGQKSTHSFCPGRGCSYASSPVMGHFGLGKK